MTLRGLHLSSNIKTYSKSDLNRSSEHHSQHKLSTTRETPSPLIIPRQGILKSKNSPSHIAETKHVNWPVEDKLVSFASESSTWEKIALGIGLPETQLRREKLQKRLTDLRSQLQEIPKLTLPDCAHAKSSSPQDLQKRAHLQIAICRTKLKAFRRQVQVQKEDLQATLLPAVHLFQGMLDQIASAPWGTEAAEKTSQQQVNIMRDLVALSAALNKLGKAL